MYQRRHDQRLLALPSGEQMGQDFMTLARIEVRNLDPGEAFMPAGYHGLLRHGAIGPTVYQDHDAKLARGPRKRGELVTTAGVVGLESPQIHQHDVAVANEGLQRVLPRRVVAIALVDPITTIDVGDHVECVDASCDIRRTDDEPLGQFSIQKLEDIVGVERAIDKVGSGNHHRVPAEAPPLHDVVEQGSRLRVLLKHPQDQQRRRPLTDGTPPCGRPHHHGNP